MEEDKLQSWEQPLTVTSGEGVREPLQLIFKHIKRLGDKKGEKHLWKSLSSKPENVLLYDISYSGKEYKDRNIY